MNHCTETDRDLLFYEVAEIRDMVRALGNHIDAGKEPDGRWPLLYREDRGARMTLKRARKRLRHIDVRLSKLTETLSQ